MKKIQVKALIDQSRREARLPGPVTTDSSKNGKGADNSPWRVGTQVIYETKCEGFELRCHNSTVAGYAVAV